MRRNVGGTVRLAAVALLASAALITACAPSTGGPGGPGGPGTGRQLMRVLSGNPLVPTDAFGGPQRAMSADFSRAAVLIPPPAGSWVTQIGVWDEATGTTTQLTNLDADTFALGQPYMTADGSTIFYLQNSSKIDPYDLADQERGVFRLDVATGAISPVSFGNGTGILDYAVDGDGDVVLAKNGWTVAASIGGVLTTLGTGTVNGTQYAVHAQSLSTNGRFAAIATSTPIGGGLQQAGITVFDLQLGTVHATWTGPTRPWNPQIIASPHDFILRIGGTTDDGSVVFTQGLGGPLQLLDGTTGTTAPTVVSDAFVDASSWNGRHVLFRGPASIDHDEQTLDLQTGSVDDAHLDPALAGNWTSVGVSDDGERILVYGTDVNHVQGYYLWERYS